MTTDVKKLRKKKTENAVKGFQEAVEKSAIKSWNSKNSLPIGLFQQSFKPAYTDQKGGMHKVNSLAKEAAMSQARKAWEGKHYETFVNNVPNPKHRRRNHPLSGYKRGLRASMPVGEDVLAEGGPSLDRLKKLKSQPKRVLPGRTST
jgi:hypothetical protein